MNVDHVMFNVRHAQVLINVHLVLAYFYMKVIVLIRALMDISLITHNGLAFLVIKAVITVVVLPIINVYHVIMEPTYRMVIVLPTVPMDIMKTQVIIHVAHVMLIVQLVKLHKFQPVILAYQVTIC